MNAEAGSAVALVPTELADCELGRSMNIALALAFARIRRNGRPAVLYRTTVDDDGVPCYLH